jgi:tetratricopeptide (TPR) repeat protein
MKLKNTVAITCFAAISMMASLLAACAAAPGQPAAPAGQAAPNPAQGQNTPGNGETQADQAAANNYASVLNSDAYDQAIAAGRSALAASPTEAVREKLADVYIARAWFYWERRLNPYALSDLSSAVQVAPAYYKVYYELGRFHNDQWQFSLGILDLNKALSLMANFAPAYSERAYSYYKNQKYDQSLADADKAIGLDPTQAAFYYNRSLAYRGLKNNDLAVADLQTVIKISNDDKLTDKAKADLKTLSPK